ncbi:MAG: TMEM175 family protein [Methanomicrobiales archaeon]
MDASPAAGPPGTGRLEAFVDAVFAIAMTLLALGITVPGVPGVTSPSKLPELLVGMWPQFFHYILAFIILALFLMGHHRQFQHIVRTDKALLWINILSLLFVCLVPFSTDLSSSYYNAEVALWFFDANLFCIGALFTLMWIYATGESRLVRPDLPEGVYWRSLSRSMVTPVVAVCAALGVLVSPTGSRYIYLLIPLMMALGQPSCGSRPVSVCW